MNEEMRHEIVRRRQGGASLRRIAKDLGLARDTVQSVVRRWEAERAGPGAPGPVPVPDRRPSLVDAFNDTIQQLLQRYPDITIARVFEELRARGFGGGLTIVRERVLELRPQPLREPVVRFETPPGAQAQMDYSTYDIDFTAEGRRRVHLFSYVLGYSRRQYLRFVEAQDLPTTLREHIRAFEHLGGVAATCLYDNMKVVVLRHTDEGPLYNPKFLAFATHYGFTPQACRVRRSQTKGKVERPFYYAETNLLNGRTFRSLEHLNEVTVWWLANVADVRIHRETKQRPLDRHAEERPYLIALPATPYDVAVVEYRVVNVEGFVAYQQNFYSVPWRHIGQASPVRVTETELIVYGPKIEEVARHVSSAIEADQNCAVDRAQSADQAVERRQRSIARRIRDARFRDLKPLSAFDWEFNRSAIDRFQIEELATGAFIQRRDNLVLVGQSGVGKSFLIQAIGQNVCAFGYSVCYITSAALLEDLTASLADQTLPKRVRHYARFDLLILDEFGFDHIERQQSPQAANLFFKIIDARARQRSTALATNIDFKAWGDYLGAPPLATAFLDRVVDGAIIIKINGKSYRAHRTASPKPAPNQKS